MAEIGQPTPVEPEIDVNPGITPVPEPLELPATAPRRREPVREPEKVPA